MSTYAIGDLQGCHDSLQALLTTIKFDKVHDRLWMVGDLVNRGPGSLECLRFLSGLGSRTTVVLGNHDLHLLAVAEGVRKIGRRDTIQAVLAAPDREELLEWLRHQKLIHVEGSYLMVHAGLLPQWSLSQARALATEIELWISGPRRRSYFEHMYGNEPNHWDESLRGNARRRLVTNVLTRMRVLSTKNELDLEFAGELASIPMGLQPWFARRHPTLADKTILAGHWAALGLHVTPNFIGIDTGCAWGRKLTALRLEDRVVFQVDCVETNVTHGWE